MDSFIFLPLFLSL